MLGFTRKDRSVTEQNTNTFKSLGLAPEVQSSLEVQGYTTPTPIQSQAIPIVMEGHDLLGIAQTGTGKTAAFALPILHHIFTHRKAPPRKGARCLVLAPTRELASQIAVSFRGYATTVDDFYVAAIFGGVPASRQIPKLAKGNDVLVATPGRLLDLIDQRALQLSDIEILVLDEADQMMDMGFIHALKKIIPLIPKKRQTLFFSATMPTSIAKLASQFLTTPQKVSVSPANTTAERVTQSVTFVNQKEKQALLTISLQDPDIDRALIFTRTKHGADRVVKKLAQTGIEALAIHGNKSQSQRQRALKSFRDGDVQFLVATDIAARGIDVEGISHVFNFEIPNVPEQYVHRIGRTARAGRSGRAVAFVAPDEKDYLKSIQKVMKMTIPVEPLPDNFVGLSAGLSKLTPLPPKENTDPNAGQGRKRGKNKRRKQAGKWGPDDRPQGKPQGKSGENRGKSKPKSSTETNRSDTKSDAPKGDRKRSDAPRGKGRNEGQKSGQSAGRSNVSRDGKPAEFKRKPRPNGGGRSGGPSKAHGGGKTPGREGGQNRNNPNNKGGVSSTSGRSSNRRAAPKNPNSGRNR